MGVVPGFSPLTILLRRRCGRPDSINRFQIGTVPGNRNMRAAFGKVVKGESRTAALEQALRDKDPEAHVVRHTGTRRKVGLAEASLHPRKW